MIALCDALKLDDDEGGLSPDAAFGFYWVTVLTQSALTYVSTRLVILGRENEGQFKQTSAYLSALSWSLPSIGPEHREHLLNHMAALMNVTRPEVDQFIEGMTVV
ncbi:MAG: hypothetical protein ABW139_19450 [Candidatus Thiodiazotropha sp. DIVDIV]